MRIEFAVASHRHRVGQALQPVHTAQPGEVGPHTSRAVGDVRGRTVNFGFRH